MSAFKIKFKLISIVLLISLIFTILGSIYVFADEMNYTDQEINFSDEGANNVSLYSGVDSDGLVTFGIESDPFSGGVHTGETRHILCAAAIDVSKFSSKYTDYIVINWDNSKYRTISDSEEIFTIYYLDFWGQVYSIEETGRFCYVDDGIRAVALDIEDHLWYDGWKWSQVTEIYCMIAFDLEAVGEEQMTPIYANYFHCDKQLEIKSITISSEGVASVTMDLDTKYPPIGGDDDYIWE